MPGRIKQAPIASQTYLPALTAYRVKLRRQAETVKTEIELKARASEWQIQGALQNELTPPVD